MARQPDRSVKQLIARSISRAINRPFSWPINEWFIPGGSFVFTVLDSDGNSFSVPLQVLNSSGTSFTVLTTVLDSDGNSFTPI